MKSAIIASEVMGNEKLVYRFGDKLCFTVAIRGNSVSALA
jgi:hypothetical protein